MRKQILIGTLLLGTPSLILLLGKLFSSSELYSDTTFVRPAGYEPGVGTVGRYTNDGFPEVIKHLDQYCVYGQGSESAPPYFYVRYCEIREGTYRQQCTGNGYSEAMCSKPEVIPGIKPEECQEKFINQRFYSTEKNPVTLFSNCAHGKVPPKQWRDQVHISKTSDYDGEQRETIHDGPKFSLTH